jgi:hypothetical protein
MHGEANMRSFANFRYEHDAGSYKDIARLGISNLGQLSKYAV